MVRSHVQTGMRPRSKQWADVILILVGAWFLILAIWADFFARIFPV